MYTRVVHARKSKQTTWRTSRRKFLFLLLVLKRRQRQLQNRRKHRFWIRKIFMKRQGKLNFSPIFSQLFFVVVFEKYTVTVVNSYCATSSINSCLVTLPCSMPAMFETNERFYKQTFGLCGFEALNHPSELKTLWDTFRSQIAELGFRYARSIANDRRSVFPYDSRTVCDLRSAIVCDHMEPAFSFFF